MCCSEPLFVITISAHATRSCVNCSSVHFLNIPRVLCRSINPETFYILLMSFLNSHNWHHKSWSIINIFYVTKHGLLLYLQLVWHYCIQFHNCTRFTTLQKANNYQNCDKCLCRTHHDFLAEEKSLALLLQWRYCSPLPSFIILCSDIFPFKKQRGI